MVFRNISGSLVSSEFCVSYAIVYIKMHVLTLEAEPGTLKCISETAVCLQMYSLVALPIALDTAYTLRELLTDAIIVTARYMVYIL